MTRFGFSNMSGILRYAMVGSIPHTIAFDVSYGM